MTVASAGLTPANAHSVPLNGARAPSLSTGTDSAVRDIAAPVDVSGVCPHARTDSYLAAPVYVERAATATVATGTRANCDIATVRVAFVDDEVANRRLGLRFLARLGVSSANVTMLRDGERCCRPRPKCTSQS